MSRFLQQVAQFILDNYDRPDQLTVLLPSHRAGVFLSRELQEQITRPIFSPRIKTIEDWVTEQTGLIPLDAPELLSRLFECYRRVNPQPQTFAEFLKWGPGLLSDFNEIDRHLVDGPAIFEYLSDVKHIEDWDPAAEQTLLLSDYLAFWRDLPQLYQQFQAELLSDELCYQGLAYRQLCEKRDSILHRQGELLGAGFSALNKAEEVLFDYLYQERSMQFLWDFDPYYYEDPVMEAGSLLRKSKLIKRLAAEGKLNFLEEHWASTSKNVEVIEASGLHQQAAIANQALVKLAGDQPENTALVMADEHLLPAFLNQLNPELPAFNVTMGLPLSSSPLCDFFELLLAFPRAREKKEIQKTPDSDQLSYRRELWERLLGHPLASQLWPGVASVAAKLARSSAFFLSESDLAFQDLPEHWPRFVFSEADPPEFFRALTAFCQANEKRLSRDQTTLFAGFARLFEALSNLSRERDFLADFQSLHFFYQQLLREEKIDLLGEPLRGLQVMGMLESRCLDFEKVVLSSVNEEILPQGRSEQSMLPFAIRKKFGLPTHEEKDAVYAYHFFRLLQRARQVTLIYDRSENQFGSADPSRFIHQLALEWAPRFATGDSTYQHKVLEVPLNLPQAEELRICKSAAVLEQLTNWAQRGISASALIKYLNDPLKFYHQYVLGVREEQPIGESLDPREQGNAVHQILEDLYQGQIGRILNADFLKKLPDERWLKSTLADYLKSERAGVKLDQGPNVLTLELMTQLCLNRFKIEKARLTGKNQQKGIRLKALEQKIAYKPKNFPQAVLFKGIIDRVETEENAYLLIDYKTGKAEATEYSLSNGLESLRDKPKALQLYFYAYLYHKNFDVEQIFPLIAPLRYAQGELLPLKISRQAVSLDAPMLEEFENWLQDLIAEIFDPQRAFQPNEE